MSIHTNIKKAQASKPIIGDMGFYELDTRKPKNTIWSVGQRFIAGFTLALLSPLFVALFFAVKITSKGPFLYKQKRPGRNGKLFYAYKIRTMRVGADKDASRARNVCSSDPMITPIGRVLRDLKIDELPQLINVLKGEMVLVGPRPIATSLHEELSTEIPGFSRRDQVRPGLTSLAQVCIFENAAQNDVIDDWTQRFEMELHYIKNRTVTYDLVIIAMTVLFLFKKIAKKVPKWFKLIPIAGFVLITTACSESLNTGKFNVADRAYERPIDAYGTRQDPSVLKIESITIPAPNETAIDPHYRVGTGDLLAINIFGEEGLDNIRVAVDGGGQIQLPFLETIEAAGKTVAELQKELKKGFSKEFRNPWVVVQVSDYKSRPIYLLGEFNKPGVIYLNGPTNLIQAMSHGQGLSDLAHLKGARLWRDEEMVAVDMQALLRDGRAEFNVHLQGGDTIYVPSKQDRKIYMLGAVVNAGAVPLSNEPMTLLKALSEAGGPVKATALLSQVRVVRTHSALEGQLILVDTQKILAGEAPDLELKPDDVVYVPTNAFASWNQALQAISPTLQMAGGVLQPFVQLKFLKGE